MCDTKWALAQIDAMMVACCNIVDHVYTFFFVFSSSKQCLVLRDLKKKCTLTKFDCKEFLSASWS